MAKRLTLGQRFSALFTGRIPDSSVISLGRRGRRGRRALPQGTDSGSSSDPRYLGDDEAVKAAIARQANTTLGEWTEQRAVKTGLKASTWVFACISRIAQNAASVPWQVQRQIADDEWEPVVSKHPLGDLFNSPNSIESSHALIERLTFHLYLTGNAVMHKTRGGSGRIEELWAVSPDNIKPVKDEIKVVSEYKITSPPQAVPFEDIMHIMFTDPADPTWGLGPLQIVAKAVSSDIKAQDWQETSMDNRATPDGILVIKKPMSEEVYNNTINKLNAKTSQARQSFVISGTEAEWMQLSMSPIEMDFLESRKLTREEICAVFNVPPPLIGIYEHATLANIETSRIIFWQETMIPFLNRLAEGFNRTVSPEFGEGIRIVPDFTQVPALRDLLKSSVQAAHILFQMGVPFNEINRRLGLGFNPIEGGGTGLVSAGMLPINALGGNDLGGIGSFGGGAFGPLSDLGGLTLANDNRDSQLTVKQARSKLIELQAKNDPEDSSRVAYLKEKLLLAGAIDD